MQRKRQITTKVLKRNIIRTKTCINQLKKTQSLKSTQIMYKPAQSRCRLITKNIKYQFKLTQGM